MNVKRSNRQNKKGKLIENIQSLGRPAGLKKHGQICFKKNLRKDR